MNKIKIITIVGTRPELIRLSLIIPLLDKYTNHILAHTGQNYDYELNEVFFENLQIRKPDFFFEINTSSLGRVLGEVIIKSEELFLAERPDAVLILGDTNSSIACIMAKRLKIPIYHMEAGNRSFDLNVPEEINRRLVDHISDFNLVYAENSRNHLLSEGLPHKRIYLTGSPMYEILMNFKSKINSSDILTKLKIETGKYFIVSTHREENVDNKDNLKSILDLLNIISETYNLPVIVSTHPRTKKRLEKVSEIIVDKRIQFMKPFGFFDYINLQMNAKCTISDSGTISEESSILGFPAISIRKSMERPEAQDSGTIILTGFDKSVVLSAINVAVDEKNKNVKKIPPFEYQIPDTSWRVLKLILGTSKLSNSWDGIQSNNL